MPVAEVVDVHTHCVPEAVITTLIADGGRYGIELSESDGRYRALIAGRVSTRPLNPSLWNVERRLAQMDASGVGVQVLSSWIDLSAYELPADTAARYSHMFNEAMAAFVAEHPDRFRGNALVPLQAPALAATELRRAVVELGLVGAEIATTVDGRDLDDPELEPFWAAAAELRCPIFLHPCNSLAGRALTRYNSRNLVGNPAETTIAVAHLVFGGVLERHPDLRIIVAHGGGFAPYQLGRWDHGFNANATQTHDHLSGVPSDSVRQLYFDTVLHSTPALQFLLTTMGIDQVVLGSDYPFLMGDPNPTGIVDGLPDLTPSQRDQILGGNLNRLFAEIRRS